MNQEQKWRLYRVLIIRQTLPYLLLFVGCVTTDAQERPRVVRTSPENGAMSVDPATNELRVTFDQPMATNSYSFVGGGPTFPEDTGRPLWISNRTIVLPIRLKPDHAYWLSINSDRYQGFRSLPSGFSEIMPRTLNPTPSVPGFRGRTVVLMGPVNVSSCEAFLLMMKQVSQCTLMGEKSYGSSGNPQPVLLSNGVTVFLPSWVAFTPDGDPFEGKGLSPDIRVAFPGGAMDEAPLINAALDFLLARPDFSGDGRVDFDDFLLFVQQFGLSRDDEGYDAKYDLDSDGTIGFEDFLIFASTFGK